MLRRALKFSALAYLLFLSPSVVALRSSNQESSTRSKDLDNSELPQNLNTRQVIYELEQNNKVNNNLMARDELWDAAFKEYQVARRYQQDRKFGLAEKFFLAAVHYFEKITIDHGSTNQHPYWDSLQDCYRGLANIYYEKNKWQEGEKYLEKTIRAIENIPSREKTSEDLRSVFRDYGALATKYYLHKSNSLELVMKSWQEAINAFNVLPEKQKNRTDRWTAAQIKSNMAKVLFEKNELRTASRYLEDVIKLIKHNPDKNPDELKLLKDAHANLKAIKLKSEQQEQNSFAYRKNEL